MEGAALPNGESVSDEPPKDAPKGKKKQRPGGFSVEETRVVGRMARYLTQEQIADVMEISSRTLRDRMRRDARLTAAYKKGKGNVIAAVARSLIFQALGGNTTAAIFFLKCQGGWRETDPRQIDVSEISKLSDKELEKEKRRMGLVR